ncbi:MAG: patatin family protein [Faecalicoccus sp.]|nr:patatin family protein [Faecalicoccus sp.]
MKIGLIVEGGGMKSAYSAGILDLFIDYGIEFDYCIGQSAGAGNLVSFVGKQRGRNLRFYTTHITENGFFGISSFLKNRELFGLHYIYETLSNSTGTDPIDYKALIESPTELKIIATEAETGLPHYFDKTEMKQDDYRILMASCAIPAANDPIEIDGIEYFDGGVSDIIPIKKAMEDGCDKVVVILATSREEETDLRLYQKKLYDIRCRKYPQIITALDERDVLIKNQRQLLTELEKSGRAFVFEPEPGLNSTYEMDPKVNKNAYNQGLLAFHDNYDALKLFMNVL